MSTAEASRPENRTVADNIATYMDDLSLPFVSLAPDGTIVTANRAWLAVVLAPSPPRGRPFASYVAAADTAAFRRCFAELLNGGGVHRSHLRLVTPDGAERPCEFEATVRLDDEGRPLQTLCFCRESGEPARTRRRLEEREHQLNIVLRHTPAAIYEYRLDPDGRSSFDYISPNVERVTGRPAGELTDPQRMLDHVHPDDREGVTAAISRSLERMSEMRHDYRTVLADGRTVWLRTRSAPRREPDGSVVWSGVTLDVTAEKGARRALERAREDERSHVAREIHDALGQSLTAVGFDLEWILRHGAREEIAERARRALEQIDTLSDEVRRIGTILRPRILDDLGIVAALEWLGSDIRARYGIETAVHAPDEVACDPDVQTGIFRIAQEALTNVTRHSAATQVEIALREESGTLRLTVTDNGRGFDSTRASSTAGGAAGMHERARNAGGSLEIASEPGRGTTVAATLPSGSPAS